MIPPSIRIFVCLQPVDMRYGFDRLAQLARERIGQDPLAGGALFVFAGKSPRRLKVLWFEQNGLCLLSKRLHGAVFELPTGEAGATTVRIDTSALCRLLGGVPKNSSPRIKMNRSPSANA